MLSFNPNAMSNRLINATSPYLLQHAHNPVDWYEWGSEALAKAKEEDKPILVSIGYSACHWCHVMERESFERNDIAKIMNDHFICIKVDREERPDVDQVYMDAVQAMGQNGGWPLNVFLTPGQQPFYGGTYFPPQQWGQLLLQINKAFHEQRAKIEESATDLTGHLNTSDLKRFAASSEQAVTRESLDQMFAILKSRYDATYGGLAKAPKFVMPTIWLFLLRYHRLTKNEEALKMVTQTLEKIGHGGIYDHLAGGFARYSVDERWFAPHFEKMLYDNAQLLSLYAEAYQVTGSSQFKDILEETVRWLEHEMRHPEGAFFSALDADSEGVEGKYYTFTGEEWRAALGADAEQAAAHFRIKPEGNWEHGRNILLADENSTASATQIRGWKQKLAEAQRKRVRPGLDDKILVAWNAMAVNGLLDTYRALGNEHFLSLATDAIKFLEKNLTSEGRLLRSHRGKAAPTEGFLEDYAFMIQAYTELYQHTFDESWLQKAKALMIHVFEHFYDPTEGYFHFSSANAEPLIARKKEIFDNVIPASNSVMARNLLRLGSLLDNDAWKEMGHTMTRSLLKTIASEPGYLSNWGIALTELLASLKEVALVGGSPLKVKAEMNKTYLPFALFAGTAERSQLPLLQDKMGSSQATTIFVCYNKSCQAPTVSVDEALRQLL